MTCLLPVYTAAALFCTIAFARQAPLRLVQKRKDVSSGQDHMRVVADVALTKSPGNRHNITELDKLQAADAPALASSHHDIAEFAKLQATCRAPAHTPPTKWNAMTTIANILERLKAPWNIHAGLLLGLVRSCSIFDDDIDIAIERQWMQEHHQEPEDAIIAAGFKPVGFNVDAQLNVAGSGYEEKFDRMTPKERKWRSRRLDWFANAVRIIHEEDDTRLDLFTIERHPDRYISRLWVDDKFHPGWENAKGHECETKSSGTETFSWLGVDVKVPVPFEDALTSLYGKDCMTPAPWKWDESPFKLGSCK